MQMRMLSRILSEALMSLSVKYNYKTFTKSPPASLLLCIANIFNHSSGKFCSFVTMAALSFPKSTSFCTKFIH